MSALSGIYARNGVTFLCNNVLVPSNKCHTSRLVFHLIKMATCWPSLLGCCNNMPQMGWLKTTEMYYLAVRRLNVWDQGFSSVGLFWDWWRRLCSLPYSSLWRFTGSLRCSLLMVFSLYLNIVFAPYISASKFPPLLWRHQLIQNRGLPWWPHFNFVTSVKTISN